MYPQSTTTKPNALTTSTFNPSEAFLLHCLPFYACNLIWKVNNLKAIFPSGFILKNQLSALLKMRLLFQSLFLVLLWYILRVIIKYSHSHPSSHLKMPRKIEINKILTPSNHCFYKKLTPDLEFCYKVLTPGCL